MLVTLSLHLLVGVEFVVMEGLPEVGFAIVARGCGELVLLTDDIVANIDGAIDTCMVAGREFVRRDTHIIRTTELLLLLLMMLLWNGPY